MWAIDFQLDETAGGRPVQFFGGDLVDAGLVGCELSGANFCARALRGADFRGLN